MNQATLLSKLAERIVALSEGRRYMRVGFDGVDTAGKTHLADALSTHPLFAGRQVIRASIDGFHYPRSVRYRQGRFSPEGYYRDSFQYELLQGKLLAPLGPGGSGVYQTEAFDYRVDQPVVAASKTASSGAILLFDGVFLAREEIRDCFELLVFLRVPFAVVLERAKERDTALGTPEVIAEMYQKRYIPGQQLYFSEASPEERADIVIDNQDYTNPQFVKW